MKKGDLMKEIKEFIRVTYFLIIIEFRSKMIKKSENRIKKLKQKLYYEQKYLRSYIRGSYEFMEKNELGVYK